MCNVKSETRIYHHSGSACIGSKVLPRKLLEVYYGNLKCMHYVAFPEDYEFQTYLKKVSFCDKKTKNLFQ